MSTTYGVVNFISSFGFTWRWRRQCVSLAQLKPGDRVCDLMTGMGECWNEILKRTGRRGELLAVDFSPAMIAAARKRIAAPGAVQSTNSEYRPNYTNHGERYSNVEIQEQDVFDPAFAAALADASPERFDALVCCFGVKTLAPEMYPGLAELLRRLLKPGGRFSFVEISLPPAAILRLPLLFYINWIIPWIGKLCLGNPDNYRMLGVYTGEFGDCSRLNESFQAAGLTVRYRRLFFGSATAVCGNVPFKSDRSVS